MKNIKLYLIIAVSITLLYNTSLCQNGWIIRATGSGINSVFFINSFQGWMVGDSGLAYASEDGGLNWSGLDSKTNSKLNCVFFKNELTGWAAGDNGTIIKTSDGGNNWTLLSSGSTDNYTSVYFPTSDTGFVVSNTSSTLRKSTDGGVSWSLPAPVSGSAIYFSSAKTGIVTSISTSLKRTTNGGTVWFSDGINYPSGKYGMSFVNSETGWVSGTGAAVSRTTNGGENWIYQPTGGGFSTMFGINFFDESTGWTVGSPGTIGGNSEIRITTNSGTNWSPQSSGTTNLLRSVSALTGSDGIAVGDAGTVLHTSNSGSNWNNRLHEFTFPSHPNYNLTSVSFINANTGWSAGQLGIINKTSNGGDTWASYSSASFNQINSVHFLDTDTGWAAGNSGMIQMTMNGGANWVSHSLSISNNLNDINIGKFSRTGFFGLHRIGWCVGNSGVIYKTINGGATWSGQLSPTSANLYSVVPFSENVAIACGDSGKILRTTDGGSVWTIQVSDVVNGALRSLSFADGNYGICAGDSATVLYTTNTGDSWILDITGPRGLTTNNLYDVSARYDIMLTYIAIGEDGVILKSEDEGFSWTKLSGGVNSMLTGIASPTDNTSYVVGTRGTVLKTVDGGALPVELTSFNYSLNSNHVVLYWQTSCEINNSGFEVERSNVKVSNHWMNIGFVEGHGNTNQSHDYSFEDRNLSDGKYKYRLRQTDYNGNYEYFNLNSEIIIGTPEKFELSQNYPNPFNPVTHLEFRIPDLEFVSLKVYDITGREVKTLVKEIKPAGRYSVTFDGSSFSSGIYFYRLETKEFIQTKKMTLIK